MTIFGASSLQPKIPFPAAVGEREEKITPTSLAYPELSLSHAGPLRFIASWLDAIFAG
jgi:hypothetical protein